MKQVKQIVSFFHYYSEIIISQLQDSWVLDTSVSLVLPGLTDGFLNSLSVLVSTALTWVVLPGLTGNFPPLV